MLRLPDLFISAHRPSGASLSFNSSIRHAHHSLTSVPLQSATAFELSSPRTLIPALTAAAAWRDSRAPARRSLRGGRSGAAAASSPLSSPAALRATALCCSRLGVAAPDPRKRTVQRGACGEQPTFNVIGGNGAEADCAVRGPVHSHR